MSASPVRLIREPSIWAVKDTNLLSWIRVIPIGSKRALDHAAHGCVVSVGIDGIIAEFNASSGGLIGIEII